MRVVNTKQQNDPTPAFQPPKFVSVISPTQLQISPEAPSQMYHPLNRIPKVIRIKEPRELPVHIYNMHIPLFPIPHNRLGILAALLIPFNINPHASVNLQLKSNLIIHQSSPHILSSFNTLLF